MVTRREIKFRAWDNNRMRNNVYPTGNSSFGYWKDEGLNEKIFWDFGIFNATIMQFTGLKDKNGVEIYEGDILFCSDAYYKLVKETAKAYELHELGSDKIFFLFNHYEKIEVIGNIHQNPELL